MQKLILVATAVLTLGQTAWGHGMMIDPPQRSSMWRYGFDSAPRNYNDNGLFCGGFARQWHTNGGKCGICGDAYDEPRENEVGGKYATGVIVKTYQQGATIDVAVKITANHKGYFVFKLCPNNDVRKEATQDCLNKRVLKVVGSNGQDLGEKYSIDSAINIKYLKLKLPNDVTCTQCVLQWTYVTANSWGCTSDVPSRCCVGCGPQENFVNCADVAITGSGHQVVVPLPVTNAPRPVLTNAPIVVTAAPRPIQTNAPIVVTAAPKPANGCQATGAYHGAAGMDDWCAANCARGYCPASHCQCS